MIAWAPWPIGHGHVAGGACMSALLVNVAGVCVGTREFAGQFIYPDDALPIACL